MNVNWWKILVLIESIIIFVLIFAFVISTVFSHKTTNDKTEVYRQSSNDGAHTVIIYEIGEPDWPFGNAHYEVDGPADFYVDVSDDGGHGRFDIKWNDDSVVITFDGKEQESAVYELPFK